MLIIKFGDRIYCDGLLVGIIWWGWTQHAEEKSWSIITVWWKWNRDEVVDSHFYPEPNLKTI